MRRKIYNNNNRKIGIEQLKKKIENVEANNNQNESTGDFGRSSSI